MRTLIIVAAFLMAVSASAAEKRASDEGPACAKMLGDGGKMSAADHRRCLIAVASTYIDAEENSIPADKQLLADDVSRHQLGTAPTFVAGAGPKIIADHGHGVIAAIKNRQWTVDEANDTAWIAYDGYLKSDLNKPSFYVAERFTIVHGLIREIMIAPVPHTDDRRQ